MISIFNSLGVKMNCFSIVKEVFSYATAFLLSCGPSQIFGLVKGALDLYRLVKIQNKISAIGKELATASSPTSLLANRAKLIRLESKKEEKQLSLQADCLALLPFCGAMLSWRAFDSTKSIKGSIMPEFAMKHLLENHQKLLAKTLFYPLSGMSFPHDDYLPHAEKVAIQVFDPKSTNHSRYLTAKFLRHDALLPRPTVVCFHGNYMTGDQMINAAQKYYNQGYDVLCPTMGGYEGSDPVKTDEESSYRDVEGIKLFLQKEGVTEAGYHGLSIGGSLAFQAATGASASTVQTKFVVADQTFTSAMDVAENIISSNVSRLIAPFAKGVARACFPKGRKILLGENVVTETDGLDNLKKAALLAERNIPLFVIKASLDHIMGSSLSAHGRRYEHNFADDLIKARYGTDSKGTKYVESLCENHSFPFYGSLNWKQFIHTYMPNKSTNIDS